MMPARATVAGREGRQCHVRHAGLGAELLQSANQVGAGQIRNARRNADDRGRHAAWIPPGHRRAAA